MNDMNDVKTLQDSILPSTITVLCHFTDDKTEKVEKNYKNCDLFE